MGPQTTGKERGVGRDAADDPVTTTGGGRRPAAAGRYSGPAASPRRLLETGGGRIQGPTRSWKDMKWGRLKTGDSTVTGAPRLRLTGKLLPRPSILLKTDRVP